jgi:phage shock protein PspC (stress-responsive transcriptional regulator)
MKKTVNINLGGIAFTIDEDAYIRLHDYLDAIHKRLGNSEAAKEVILDIEARLAELFSAEKGNNNPIVNITQVELAIAAMGKPEDIAGENSTSAEESQPKTAPTENRRISKKLYRNPDDKKIGGVISGISAYFGIEDPVWLRLLAIALLFLSWGTTGFVYFMLWIVIPEATTTSQKLEMKGEPVTLDNIQKEVSETANKINDWSKRESVGDRLVNFVGALLKIAMKVIAAFVVVIALIMLFGFIAASLGTLTFVSLPPVQKLADVYAENGTMAIVAIIGLTLVVIMPLLSLLYAGIRLLVGVAGRSPKLKWIFSGGFLLGLILLAISIFSLGINFRSIGSTKEQFSLLQPANGNLFVQLADSSGVVFEDVDDDEKFGLFFNGEMLETRTGYKIGKPHLKLTVSKDSTFYIDRIIDAQGKNKSNAIQNAKAVNYNFTQVDTTLNLNSYVEVKKGNKWRNQNVTIQLAIPEGKKVLFAENIDYIPATVKGDESYDATYFANTTWTVKNGKVVCLNCEHNQNEEEDDNELHEPLPPTKPLPPNIKETPKKGAIKETKIATEKGEVTVQTKEGKNGQEVEIRVKEKK